MKKDQKSFRYQDLLLDGYVLKKTIEIDDPFAACYQLSRENIISILQENSSIASTRESKKVNELIHNIISFMGARGTGKTSVMFSFLENLKSGSCSSMTPMAPELERTEFIVLSSIDAEILRYHEDIMEIVLARMLNNILAAAKKADHLQEPLRDLYRRFDTTFKNLRYLRTNQAEPLEAGESALHVLKELSGSHTVERDFRELVQKYLEVYRSIQDNAYVRESYLVITIDDVDLYHPRYKNEEKYAYDLLKQIYDFLSIPNVIVFVACDESRLKRECVDYFLSNAKNKEIADDEAQYTAQQFLQKVLPTHRHIYLPDFENIDIAEADQPNSIMKIRLQPEQQKNLFGTNQENNLILGSKELILRLIAQRTNVFFDIAGEKKHFFEERNLRELHDFLRLITELDSPEKETDRAKKEQIFAQNRTRMLNYLYNSFILRVLNVQEEQQFKKWMTYPLPRRSREILDIIRENVEKPNPELYQSYRYSYGEMLQYLYHSTRGQHSYGLSQSGRDPFLSKPMVHCILSTYSFALSNLYWKSLYAEDEDASQDAQGYFYDTLGSSIAGRWANKMIVQGVVKGVDGTSKPLGIGSAFVDKLVNAWKLPIRLPKDFSESKVFSAAFLKDLIRRTEWLGMFFTEVSDFDDAGYQFEISRNAESPDSEAMLTIGKSDVTACYNILNFCINSLKWKSYFPVIHKSLKAALGQFLFDTKWEKPEECDEETVEKIRNFDAAFTKIAQEDTFYQEYKEWNETYGCLVFPVQNFDMSYNILKRLADSSKNGMPKEPIVLSDKGKFNVSADKIHQYYRQLLLNITNALKQQDELYQTQNTFEKIFVECPFVKVLLSQKSSYATDLKRLFENIVLIANSAEYVKDMKNLF